MLLVIALCLLSVNSKCVGNETQCKELTGCVWNPVRSICEEHTLNYQSSGVLSQIKKLFSLFFKSFAIVIEYLIQFIKKYILEIGLTLCGLVSIAGIVALISQFEMKNYERNKLLKKRMN
ncbi:Single tm domain protein [Entamoeba marina]